MRVFAFNVWHVPAEGKATLTEQIALVGGDREPCNWVRDYKPGKHWPANYVFPDGSTDDSFLGPSHYLGDPGRPWLRSVILPEVRRGR